MLRRHAALNTLNVFAKQCAQDLSVAELKRGLLEGDEKILNKLLYFAAPIPETRQAYKMQRHIRRTSNLAGHIQVKKRFLVYYYISP